MLNSCIALLAYIALQVFLAELIKLWNVLLHLDCPKDLRVVGKHDFLLLLLFLHLHEFLDLALLNNYQLGAAFFIRPLWVVHGHQSKGGILIDSVSWSMLAIIRLHLKHWNWLFCLFSSQCNCMLYLRVSENVEVIVNLLLYYVVVVLLYCFKLLLNLLFDFDELKAIALPVSHLSCL